MTEGTSQGLFVVVAIVIFGIFVGLSYNLFGKVLQPQMVGIFETALNIERPETPPLTPPVVDEDVVVFGDVKLETVVRTKLGLTAEEPITPSKMQVSSFTSIDFSGKSITSLKGLEHAKNLTYILGVNNEITDLTPLSELTELRRLIIFDNNIVNLKPLSGLINLTELNLLDNNIRDVSPLSSLINLQDLNLVMNNITDYSPVSFVPNLSK